MEKILAFFGAFNPPTTAHIALAEKAVRDTGSDGAMFVLSKANYITDNQGKDFAFDDDERVELLNRIASTRPWMRVCDWELKQQTQPRTYITLCHLRDEGYTPRLLIGSDKLAEIGEKWRYVDEMLSEFGIVCIERGGDDCRAIIDASERLTRYSERITLVSGPDELRHVSSSLVRDKLRCISALMQELAGLVPPETVDSILYNYMKEDAK
ncbi:MAG: hypothetical protein II920_10695 [Clostridia bacterium]|nr:hypothetical protein [Clostridia bacterium]